MIKSSFLFCVFIFSFVGTRAQELNTWVKTGEKVAGCRVGSAVVWLDKEMKFLVIGGIRSDNWTEKSGIPKVSLLMKFSPSENKWEEVATKAPEGKINFTGFLGQDSSGEYFIKPNYSLGSYAYDSKNQIIYVSDTYEKSLILASFDIKTLKWSKVMESKPDTVATGSWQGEYRDVTYLMDNASLAVDELNQEILYIGGRTGNKDDGFEGNWAYSLKNQTWRSIDADPIVEKELFEKLKSSKKNFFGIVNQFRNHFYQMPEVQEKNKEAYASLLKNYHESVSEIKSLKTVLESVKAEGWQGVALKSSVSKLSVAIQKINTASDVLKESIVNSAVLVGFDEAYWEMDEAISLLFGSPGARMEAGVNLDPRTNKILVFGGDHGDYLLGDTWLYDCAPKKWERVLTDLKPKPRRAPGAIVDFPGLKKLGLAGGKTYSPKFIYYNRIDKNLGDVWTFDMQSKTWNPSFLPEKDNKGPALSCAVAVSNDNTLLGISSGGRFKVEADYWSMKLAAKVDISSDTVSDSSSERLYFSVIPEYDPKWYDTAEKNDSKVVASFIESLPENTWVQLPKAERSAPQRDWGTAVFDHKRDQWYYWTGGHMADPSNMMSTYHPGLNLWSAPYIPSYSGKGLDFNGRPDCRNHTYLTYAMDPFADKLICTTGGSTSVFDPGVGDFIYSVDNPFRQHGYYTKLCSTPKGVVVWAKQATQDFFALFDVKNKEWKSLPVTGNLPSPPHGDEATITYDPKRNVLWLCAAIRYRKMSGRIWKYDMTTGEVKEIAVKNLALGKSMRNLREAVYIPEADLIFYNANIGENQVAFNPNTESWVLLNTKWNEKDKKELRIQVSGVSLALMYDLRRKVIWGQCNSRKMFAMRINAETLSEVAIPEGMFKEKAEDAK